MTDAPANLPAPKAPSPWARALQITGWLGGLALLGWCIAWALNDHNRAQLDSLRHADPSAVAALLALAALSLFTNGIIFWGALKPKQSIDFWDTQATNALATLVALLPFKLSIALRFLVHNRKHGLPLVLIFAWFGAVTLGISAATLPQFCVGLFYLNRGLRIDLTAAFITAITLVIAYLTLLILARLFAGNERLASIQAFADRALPRVLARFLHSKTAVNLHAGLDMLADPLWLAVVMLGRTLDLFIISARMKIAAHVLGVQLPWSDAVVLGPMHYLIGTFSPTGSLGTREAGTVGFASYLHNGADFSKYAPTMLLVLASELPVQIAAALWSLVRLRPHRLSATPAPLPSPDAPGLRTDQPDRR